MIDVRIVERRLLVTVDDSINGGYAIVYLSEADAKELRNRLNAALSRMAKARKK